MEVKVIDAVRFAFKPRNILFCLVNEAALNYYNVPRALNALEICVAEQDLDLAASRLASYTDVFQLYPWPDEGHRNIYTDYKKPYPRFQAFIEGRYLSLIVFPDTFFHLHPLIDNIVQSSTYSTKTIKFSRQFDYSPDANVLWAIPVPKLASLLQGLARRFVELNDFAMAGMCAEQLVDGMNLDKTWCLDHLDMSRSEEIHFIYGLVETKNSRLSQFEPDNITGFVATDEEAQELVMIPGYSELSLSREVQIQPKALKTRSPSLLQSISTWIRSKFLFLKSKLPGDQSTPVSFQYMSDLHLEVGQRYKSFAVPKTAPYLILAGDIGRLRDYDGMVAFLAVQCAQFDRVFLVLGNHEFYGISRVDGLEAAKRLEVEPQLLGKLSTLNRNRFDINRRVSILGCTLHSHIPEESKLWVRMKVADFSSIDGWTVESHNAEHLLDVAWLQHQIRDIAVEDPKRQVIIVTHHAPSFSNTSDPRYKTNPWGSAFCTGLLDTKANVWNEFNNVRRWIFGHTHWNTEFRKHGMLVSSNQLGYPPFGHEPQESLALKIFKYYSSWLGQDFLVTKIAQV